MQHKNSINEFTLVQLRLQYRLRQTIPIPTRITIQEYCHVPPYDKGGKYETGFTRMENDKHESTIQRANLS